ncbi:MAG: deoxynucleoside kinase [Saprospiraceae bacterium]|nr:deoxynucleoside kinase [Saprospiraceae bacterium]
MDSKAKYIAIAGNIGAGKTTLSTQLAKYFNWQVHYENADDNPYLADFYEDMKRWAFNLQIFFLNSRYQQVLKILHGEHTVIQDRTIYEDAHIFAPNLHEMGLMSKRDFDNYFQLFMTMSQQIAAPDLLIYLRASIPTLVSRIHDRGREYEGSMSLDYLKRLNERYEEWIKGYDRGKLLIIDADVTDFINQPQDLGKIIAKVNAELHGLF